MADFYTPVAPAPRFLKPREFAVLVGVDEGTIYRAITRGEIRAARIGTRHLIPVTEVERLEAEAAAGGGSMSASSKHGRA